MIQNHNHEKLQAFTKKRYKRSKLISNPKLLMILNQNHIYQTIYTPKKKERNRAEQKAKELQMQDLGLQPRNTENEEWKELAIEREGKAKVLPAREIGYQVTSCIEIGCQVRDVISFFPIQKLHLVGRIGSNLAIFQTQTFKMFKKSTKIEFDCSVPSSPNLTL